MDRDLYLKLLDILEELAPLINLSTLDVKINGVSIIEDGVANIPPATTDNLGVVIVGTGLAMDLNNKLFVRTATDAGCKAGTASNYFIPNAKQHAAAFYGIAKAAGDDTQSASDNPVGTYTDSAIDAIIAMFGLDTIIGRHEKNSTPTASIANNEVFIYNGKLYKATAAIATTDTITPGTNCTTTNIIDLLGGT